MLWSEVINNPSLKNLPFKIELNRYGKIEMSPASNKHGRLKVYLASLLNRKLKQGTTIIQCAIQTIEGVKVADVVWCSKAFIKQYNYQTPYLHAPEICLEIVSPSHSKEEMLNKVELYLNTGAIEVWIVWENGMIDFYNYLGQLTQSNYNIDIQFPKF